MIFMGLSFLEEWNVYRSQYQKQNKYDLYKQYGRHPEQEIPVSGLMPEKVHAYDGTDAPTYDGDSEKRGFRDPESALSCFLLIDPHNEETEQIHSQYVDDKY